MNWRASLRWLFVASALAVAGCPRHDSGSGHEAAGAASAASLASKPAPAEPAASAEQFRARSERVAGLPRAEVLRLALISSQPAETVARYGALIDWLAARAGYRAGELVVHDSAELLIGKLCDGSADLLLESVYPIVVSMVGCKARPVAIAAKGNSYHYTSTIIVRKDSDVNELAALGGRDILFEDDRSTSAYLVPRSMLEQAGLLVEPADQAARPNAVRYRFGREEMNSVGWVVHGLVSAAAISDQDLAEFPDAELRVLAKSDPMPRQGVSLSPGLALAAQERIRAALLDATTAEDAKAALKVAKTAGFIALTDDDRAFFARMQEMVAKLEKRR